MSRSKAIIKPDLQLTLAAAQALVAQIGSGWKVAGLSERLGGDISGVYEARLVGGAHSLIIKMYPDMRSGNMAST
jgi:hypothetical protein